MDPQSLKAALDAHANKVETIFVDLTERLDDLETRIARNRLGGIVDDGGRGRENAEARNAFAAYLRRGEKRLTPDEFKNLITSDDTQGGYLAPAQFVVELLRNVVQFSPVRQAARVGKTSSGEVRIPRRTGTVTGTWVGETETRTETAPSYGQLSIPICEAAFYIDASNSMIDDSAFNIQEELAFDAAEEIGKMEGTAFLLGDHPKKPEGLLVNSSIASVPSGAATTITADGFIDTLYNLAPAYRNRATWMMSGTTLAYTRKLKDGNGQYIWQAGLSPGQPEHILGRPVLEGVDMPAQGAGVCPVLVGDFSNYRIYDRLELSVLHDPFTLAVNGQTRYHFRRRTGGAVGRAEAFKKMICSVS